jgi:hypothetical protein
MGVLILQQAFDLTDIETVEQLSFNIQWHYALNITSNSDQATYMSPKTLWNNRDLVSSHNLDKSNRSLPPPPTICNYLNLLLRKAASARPTGRLARGLKPPAFSRILFQLAVQSASFLCHQLSAGGCSLRPTLKRRGE